MSLRVQNHKPVWELHTSATPPSLFAVAATTNLVGQNIFISVVERHKNKLLKDLHGDRTSQRAIQTIWYHADRHEQWKRVTLPVFL